MTAGVETGPPPCWRCEIDAGVALVTLDRPDRRNALDSAAHYGLDALWNRLASDNDIRCVILTGAGPVFCAGYDIKETMETGVMDVPASGFAGLTFRLDFPHPIIAAVNGAAFGGGFETVLACDLVVASTTATFALPEVKIGWAPVGGGVQRLPRAIGLTRALGIILTGRTVPADEGRELGFVNEVVPPEALLSAARRWADTIAAAAPLAARYSRQIARMTFDRPIAEMVDLSNFPMVDELLASDDAKEGRKAFFERRAPRWSGR